MAVREARTEDVREVQRVAESAWHAAHDDIVGEATVDDFLADHYVDADVRSAITDPTTQYYVATDETEAVVGFVAGGPWRDSETTFAIGAIYVRPSRWGEGFGTRLLERFEAAIREDDGERVRLVVMSANDAAIGFYESVGYDRVEETYDDHLDVKGYVYAKRLRA